MCTYKKIFPICILVFLSTHLSNAESEDTPIRVLSENAHSACFVNCQKENGYIKYDSFIYKHADKREIIETKATFNSKVNFTTAYVTDQLLIFTNNKTNDFPTMGVINLESKSMKICRLAHFPKDSTTIKSSHIYCTPNGCFAEDAPPTWHNDVWYKYATGAILRLGDTIPNRCTVMWRYDYESKCFFLSEELNSRRIEGEDHEISIRQRRFIPHK